MLINFSPPTFHLSEVSRCNFHLTHATQTPKCCPRMGLRVLLGPRHLWKFTLSITRLFSRRVQGREERPAAPRRAPRPRHCYPSSRLHPDPDREKISPRPCQEISGILGGKPVIFYCPPALSGLTCRRFPSFPAAEVGSGRARLAQNRSLLGRPLHKGADLKKIVL